MKKEIKEFLGLIFSVILFIYIGFAVILNVTDELRGTDYAFWLNLIGFVIVPFIAFGITIQMYRSNKKLTKG